MEEKIITASKIIAGIELSGKPDLNWHLVCAGILKLGLNQSNLKDFVGTHPNFRISDIEQNNEKSIYAVANYIYNFLSVDPMNISYCAEIQCYIQKFAKQYI